MYIWIAANIDRQFVSVRSKALELSEHISIDKSSFTLPQHVSLKISFEVADSVANEVIEDVSQYLARCEPFTIGILPIERNGSILWIPIKDNEFLTKLHEDLDALLCERYGVRQHAFDKCYKFHSTLFIDCNISLLEQIKQGLDVVDIPQKVTVDEFVIGTSKSGVVGTFGVVRNVILPKKV